MFLRHGNCDRWDIDFLKHCRYFCTISRGICSTLLERTDRLIRSAVWLLKSACMSAISSCEGNICIKCLSFSVICFGFTFLFSHCHDTIMMKGRSFKASYIKLIQSESFKIRFSLSLMERRYWAKINIVYFLNYRV